MTYSTIFTRECTIEREQYAGIRNAAVTPASLSFFADCCRLRAEQVADLAEQIVRGFGLGCRRFLFRFRLRFRGTLGEDSLDLSAALALSAQFFRFFGGEQTEFAFHGTEALLHGRDGFQDEEEHQRGEQEGDDRHDESAPVDVDGLGEVYQRGIEIADEFHTVRILGHEHGDESGNVAERNGVDERLEDAVDKSVDDRGERGAYDHAYGKPHDVAAGDEFLEFGQDLRCFELFHDISP